MITVPTTDRAYGTLPAGSNSHGFGHSSSTFYAIAYKDLGREVLDRVYTLWRARRSEDFIPNGMLQSADTTSALIPRAEQMLETINIQMMAGAPR